jgi:hypothetical protein
MSKVRMNSALVSTFAVSKLELYAQHIKQGTNMAGIA